MILSDPPHTVDIYRVTVAFDGASGPQPQYTLAMGGVRCLLSVGGSSETEAMGTNPLRDTATVAFVQASLPAPILAGYVLDSPALGRRYRVVGVRSGIACGGIPALVYCDCEAMS